MATVTTKLTWNKKTLASLDQFMIEGLFSMAYDIAAQARRRAPVVTSALRNSIRVEEDGQTVYIKSGGILSSGVIRTGSRKGTTITRNVDYALKREQGPNRNPATEHYMENAKKAIMTGNYMTKYFGGITK